MQTAVLFGLIALSAVLVVKAAEEQPASVSAK